jgi:hypothetical protein
MQAGLGQQFAGHETTHQNSNVFTGQCEDFHEQDGV